MSRDSVARPTGSDHVAARAGRLIRAEVRADEVMALLVGLCQGALRGGWPAELRDRTLAIDFAGLRTSSGPGSVVGGS